MSKYLNMTDAFDIDEETIEERMFNGTLSKEEATYAAHAVSVHDELVQLNQEMIEVLEAVEEHIEVFPKVVWEKLRAINVKLGEG